jgi:hypothetical protein
MASLLGCIARPEPHESLLTAGMPRPASDYVGEARARNLEKRSGRSRSIDYVVLSSVKQKGIRFKFVSHSQKRTLTVSNIDFEPELYHVLNGRSKIRS